MSNLNKHAMPIRANGKPHEICGRGARGRCWNGLAGWLLAAAVVMVLLLSACGGSGSSNVQNSSLAGNWQYTVSPPGDGSFSGGLQGGFLLQSGASVTGAAVYAVSAPKLPPGLTNPCNSGSAPITGTLSSQGVTLTAVAGSQTFTLTGTVSSDGSTMMGTYTSTAGTAGDGVTSCGTAQSGLQWSAISVPTLTGPIQGTFHSTGGSTGLANQDFVVSGALSQGENIGASNATVTGFLSFINPDTNLSVYPCFATADVNGQISGSSVILQVIGTNGSVVGQIGEPAGSFGTTGVNPVTFNSAQGGYILQGAEPTYIVATSACQGSLGNTTTAGDFGNICLGLGNATACQQLLLLSPTSVSFPAQLLGSAATTQTITLTNNTSSPQNGLTLNFANNGDNQFDGQSDFNGLPSFTEQDNCAASPGATFSLGGGDFCSITIVFAPQESCPWLPFGNPPAITGAAPEWCPLPQTAEVTVQSQSSPDGDKFFATPISGLGLSAIQVSTPELDFGAVEQFDPPEASLPQTLSFTNISGSPLQILGRASCVNPLKGQIKLPHPLLATSTVAGLQVVTNGSGGIGLPIAVDGDTILYNCDSDPGSELPNFQISADKCTGTLLASQASCSVQVAYVPQPKTDINSGLDFFLELNTVQCSGTITTDCEIDSGRFPVEFKANTPSPLRMSPAAGLDFGNQKKGTTSAPMTITLLNDPNLTNPQTVTFVGQGVVSGNYAESDDCPSTLAPGSSCTLTITFTPGGTGFIPGTLTINYTPAPFGEPQVVYLRGTGQ
jgi:hypothetical protein